MARSKRALSLEAARAALKTRQKHNKRPWEAFDVIDLAEAAGLEVWFVPLGSLEGMYYSGEVPTILLPSDRPPGRQAFSCAHELGHHVFGHGSRLDAYIAGDSTDQTTGVEWLADMFAAFLMMPATAVSRGFRERGWEPGTASPVEILQVAQWLGVGYSTLVNQMTFSLGCLSFGRYDVLRKLRPIDLCADFLEADIERVVTIVGADWSDRAIDLQVGSLIALPPCTSIDGDVLNYQLRTSRFLLSKATTPGRGRVILPTGKAVFVRVARVKYQGRACYRFLPDPDLELGLRC